MKKIHLIEPTLGDQAGHCYGYVDTLVRYAKQEEIAFTLWLGRGAQHLVFQNSPSVKEYFFYKLRKIQLYFLYRKLIKNNENIFVPTAGRLDLVFIKRLLKQRDYSGQIFLHFHQLSLSPQKMALLKHIAQQTALQPIQILTPTDKLSAIFTTLGFQNVRTVCCPVPFHEYCPASYTTAPGLLYAGAARDDKGFSHVVDLIAYLETQQETIEITLQASESHRKKHDPKTQAALSRLASLHYPSLKILPGTLSQQEFQTQFANKICLLLYDAKSYEKKFSGVLLEAVFGGAPIITVSRTWMGDVTQEFSAGIVLEDLSLESVYAAILEIRNDFKRFQANVHRAAEVLKERHHPRHTLQVLTNSLISHTDKTSPAH